jgi:hypothetical protein
MTVSGVNSALLGAIAARLDRVGPSAPDPRDPSRVNGRVERTPAHPTTGMSGAGLQGGLGVTPPEGVDPALWSVLTGEERAFFAQQAAAGPLTYGRMGITPATPAASIPVARGGRLDIRV